MGGWEHGGVGAWGVGAWWVGLGVGAAVGRGAWLVGCIGWLRSVVCISDLVSILGQKNVLLIHVEVGTRTVSVRLCQCRHRPTEEEECSWCSSQCPRVVSIAGTCS